MREKHEAYVYHVSFNAMHNLTVDNPRKMHAHTFRVGMYVTQMKENENGFLNNEKFLEEYFETYRGIRLNELRAFRDTIPTLEHMGEHFFRELTVLFAQNGQKLLTLEIGDSPVSVYCIGERLLLGDVYNMTVPGEVEAYCERVRERYGMSCPENGQAERRTGEESYE